MAQKMIQKNDNEMSFYATTERFLNFPSSPSWIANKVVHDKYSIRYWKKWPKSYYTFRDK